MNYNIYPIGFYISLQKIDIDHLQLDEIYFNEKTFVCFDTNNYKQIDENRI